MRVHDRFSDLCDSQITVCGQEVLDSRYEVFEVGGDAGVFEGGGEAVRDGGEAAEKFGGGGGGLSGRLGGGRGHHCHACCCADSARFG